MNLSTLTLLVAGFVSLLTWAVSRKALKDNPVLNNPLIPICVAGLSFLGLTSMGEGWCQGILLLYAAMALAILLALLFAGMGGRRSRKPDDMQDSMGRHDETDFHTFDDHQENEDNGGRE